MSAFRKITKGVSKGVLQTTRLAERAADRVKDGTIDIIKDAREGIRDGLADEKGKELKRSNSDHFHVASDDESDPDLSMKLSVPEKPKKRDFGYSIRPSDDVVTSDDEMYLESASGPQTGEMGLNDDDDDSAKATKKKKKVKKIKYRRSGDDSDGSDESAKSTKSSKSSKSGKSRKKKKPKDRAKRSDASVGSRRKKVRPERQTSNASVKSDTSGKKKKKKKPAEPMDTYSSDDLEDERMDDLAPLANDKKDPVLPVRDKSPTRSPSTKKKFALSSPSANDSEDGPKEHPIKQELSRFSDIWKTQAAGEEEIGDNTRESLTVGKISAALGELQGEIGEANAYDNDMLDAKLRSTEQKLHDSEAKVEELIIAKSDIQKELNEEQLRNDEVARRLLYLEDKVEELENEKKELEAHPKVIEQQADPIEVFELQQEVNTLKTEMSIKLDQHAEALHSKNEKIKELEAKLEAGGAQPRESLAAGSMHSTVSAGGDAKTQGLLLRSNDRIQKQDAEIRELKQKLEELGNAEIIEEKDEEIKNLGVQMFELETKMKDTEDEHEKALKQKDETISFFQNQVVEMQKNMPRPAAYTRKPAGEEGTMSLGGEEPAEEGGGLWGLVSRASPGLLGGRQTVDRRRAREAPAAPNL